LYNTKISSASHDYHLSFVSDAFEEVRRISRESPCAVLVDKNVYDLYEDRVSAADLPAPVIEVDSSEKEKEYSAVSGWIESLIKKGFRRDHTIITIGGGVLQDLSGFIAATIYRGVRWIYVPTTLLSQADSCIGSKVSINLGDRKNTLGLFYPPHQIYVDPGLLGSLPPCEFKSGVGEIIKFNLMCSQTYEDTRAISTTLQDKNVPSKEMERIIRNCLSIKRSYFEDDEFDKGRRNLCNYGHCFGHALESASGFTIPHGQAVLVGILVADEISFNRGLISAEVQEYNRACSTAFVPDATKVRAIDIEEVARYMYWDKKRTGKDLAMVLYEGHGRISVYQDVTSREVNAAAQTIWETL